MRNLLNGLNFNVLDEGKGQPVLHLQGYPDSIKGWRKVIMLLLEKGYSVIAYDQRRYGETDVPVSVEEYRVENIVKDAVSILAALKVNLKICLMDMIWAQMSDGFFPWQILNWWNLTLQCHWDIQ